MHHGRGRSDLAIHARPKVSNSGDSGWASGDVNHLVFCGAVGYVKPAAHPPVGGLHSGMLLLMSIFLLHPSLYIIYFHAKGRELFINKEMMLVTIGIIGATVSVD